MEGKSIEFRHPELEESFSFRSCCDFNSSSSLPIFSSDTDDDDDDESYIEIALAPAHGGDGEEEEEACDHKQMEMRISFSSNVKLNHQESTNTIESYESDTDDSCASSSFTFSSSFAESQRNIDLQLLKSSKQMNCESRVEKEKNVKSKVQFPGVNRFVSTFISSFKLSTETGDPDVFPVDASRLELVPTRNIPKNAPKITATATATTINSAGMMMNFFVKCRALKLKELLASFVKASQTNSGGKKQGKSFRANYNQNLVRPIENKGLASEKKQANNGQRSRTLELNFDSIRGYLLAAMNINVNTSAGRRDTRTKSCPVSSKASPIHQQQFFSESYNIAASTDNSIQAAIAHCKKSFTPKV